MGRCYEFAGAIAVKSPTGTKYSENCPLIITLFE